MITMLRILIPHAPRCSIAETRGLDQQAEPAAEDRERHRVDAAVRPGEADPDLARTRRDLPPVLPDNPLVPLQLADLVSGRQQLGLGRRRGGQGGSGRDRRPEPP